MKKKILQILNIRSDETWLVTNLFWLQFFQGFGIAVFNTVSTTLFVGHMHGEELASELPKTYIFSSVLLLITGYVYSKFEHAIEIKKLVLGVILFMAASILLFRLQIFFSHSAWVAFVLFSWYNVIYLLGNLEFWGVAALMFDIRQSKRLFGMIGAGDIPAKLAGYSVVPILIALTSAENLLFLSLFSFLCSLVFYFRLKKAGKLDLHVKHEHVHASSGHGDKHKHYYSTEKLTGLIKSFFSNRMISYVAGLSFIVVTCVTIITFAFYSQVKHEMHNDEQFASVISIFFIAGGVIAIVVRLILTGRLANILGIRGSLLISPIILAILLVGVMLLPFATEKEVYYLYAFGLMMILTQVLKIALQDPVFLSAMQPLSSNLRLKGHATVKGVMDPFAMGFSGILLLTLVEVTGKVDLHLLTYILSALVVVWVIMIFFVDREYVKTLVTALHKRYVVGQDIDLSDDQTRAVLEDKIVNGERGEAIYILNLIDKQYTSDKEEFVVKALSHPRQEVRMEAIKLSERHRIAAALPMIEEIIAHQADAELLPEAVKAKCMLLPDELESLDEFIEDKDHRLVKAAITGLMTSGGINAMVTAGQRLLQLIASAAWEERKMGAEIIGDLGVQTFYKPLLQLMNDEHEEVAKAAIVAAGKVKNEKLIGPLMQTYLQHKHEKLVIDSLFSAGDVALDEVKQILTHKKLTRQQQTKLILLCGRIGTEKATKILDELVWKLMWMHAEIFHALHLCQYRITENRQQHIELMHHYIDCSVEILFMIREVEKGKTTKVLANALQLELHEIRDTLLLLFSFVFDQEKMMKAKSAFMHNKQESIANALEVIEIEVPKDISLRFAKVFEPGTVKDKCEALSVNYKDQVNYEVIVDNILSDKRHHYNRWTKATALHSAIFYKGSQKRKWLEHAGKENDILLKETAQKILSEMN